VITTIKRLIIMALMALLYLAGEIYFHVFKDFPWPD